jgi:hypothetical protein
VNKNPFHQLGQISEQQFGSDWDVSARRFDALFYGRGSQFRKMVDELSELNPRASSAFQRLGEIQMATGASRPWLVLHHASSAAVAVAQEIAKYEDCRVDCLDSFWQSERITTVERLHDHINDRLAPTVWGFSDLGFPEFAERWSDWQDSYCAGIRNAHSLTRTMTGKKRRAERLQLCVDNVLDHLDELRELFRDMREVTGPGGWWDTPEVLGFLSSED